MIFGRFVSPTSQINSATRQRAFHHRCHTVLSVSASFGGLAIGARPCAALSATCFFMVLGSADFLRRKHEWNLTKSLLQRASEHCITVATQCYACERVLVAWRLALGLLSVSLHRVVALLAGQ